jgi:hypothetical protein
MQLATQNSRDCIFRPVDWRWLRVGELIATKSKPQRRADYDHLLDIYSFRELQDAARNPGHHIALAAKMPALYEAWRVYNSTKHTCKWEMEARLLTQESIPSVATSMGTNPAVVALYEQCFFNVFDRLESPGFITHQVFGHAVHIGVNERPYDLLWKMYGYWMGAVMLDYVIYMFNAPDHPSSPTVVPAAVDQDISIMSRYNAMMANRRIRVDAHNAEAIMNGYLQLLAIERNVKQGGGSADSLLENVASMLKSIPWQKHIPDERIANVVEDYEHRGVGIRSSEMTMLALDRAPAGFSELIASAKFPEVVHAQ